MDAQDFKEFFRAFAFSRITLHDLMQGKCHHKIEQSLGLVGP